MVGMATHPEGSSDRPTLPPFRGDHRRTLNRELRTAFIAGAEDRSLREQGRGLTEEELRRVLARYPGDLRKV
jgi:hypothetical protein